MAMAADVRALWCALHDLRDALLPVRMITVEDRPETVAPQPVQAMSSRSAGATGRSSSSVGSGPTRSAPTTGSPS